MSACEYQVLITTLGHPEMEITAQYVLTAFLAWRQAKRDRIRR